MLDNVVVQAEECQLAEVKQVEQVIMRTGRGRADAGVAAGVGASVIGRSPPVFCVAAQSGAGAAERKAGTRG